MNELPQQVVVAANTFAKVYALPPRLVLAMIRVESGGDTWAWNPEPHYPYLWNVSKNTPFRPLTAAERSSETPPGDFPTWAGDRDAEWWGQQASWGCLQVMGAVAREYGFRGHLPGLCDVRVGIEYGCKHLSALVRRHSDKGMRAVAAAYNAGSVRYIDGTSLFVNQAYVDKVARAGGFFAETP